MVILINIVYDINRESQMENISGHTIVFIINSLRKMPVDLTSLLSEINQNCIVKIVPPGSLTTRVMRRNWH